MGAGRSRSEQVGAGRSRWEQVGAGGSRWEQVGASGSRWKQVGVGGVGWSELAEMFMLTSVNGIATCHMQEFRRKSHFKTTTAIVVYFF